MKSLFLSTPSTQFDDPGLHLVSSFWCSWLLESLCWCMQGPLPSDQVGYGIQWKQPLAGVITIVRIQSIAKISCNTRQARGKSIQWAAWTNLCSINVAFQTLWQCLCSKKMVKTLLPPIITAVLLPLGKQCQSREGAQLAVTRKYVGECRMKSKTEITIEAFLRRKGIYEERMRTGRWKMEKEGKRKTSETRTGGEGKRKGRKSGGKSNRTRSLKKKKHYSAIHGINVV